MTSPAHQLEALVHVDDQTLSLTATMHFPADHQSVGEARNFVADVLKRHGLGHDTAVLLVSEVATNAVDHGRTAFALSLNRTPVGLEFEIRDYCSVIPVLRAAEPDDERGRGLALIDALSLSWDVLPQEDGKIFRFTISEEPPCPN